MAASLLLHHRHGPVKGRLLCTNYCCPTDCHRTGARAAERLASPRGDHEGGLVLAPKNVQSMRALFNIAHRLSNVLGPAWALVLETMNTLDTILHSPHTTAQVGNAKPCTARFRCGPTAHPSRAGPSCVLKCPPPADCLNLLHHQSPAAAGIVLLVPLKPPLPQPKTPLPLGALCRRCPTRQGRSRCAAMWPSWQRRPRRCLSARGR